MCVSVSLCECLCVFFNIIYLALVVLGLRSCAQAFCSCSEQEQLLTKVHGLLVAERGLSGTRALGHAGTTAQAQ